MQTGANSFGKSDIFSATMIVSGGIAGGLSSAIAGGNFWAGFKQGIITAGLNHLAHAFAVDIELTKFQKFLIKNGYADDFKGLYVRANQTDLNKLKEIFQDYWKLSSQQADFATDELITNLENNKLIAKGTLVLDSVNEKLMSDGKSAWGVTQVGVILIRPWIDKMQLALTFVHETIHSIDYVSCLETNLIKTFQGLSSDILEARAYLETSRITGYPINNIGMNYISNSFPILLQFNLFFSK